MIQHILNHRVQQTNTCAFSDLHQKFAANCYKVKRAENAFSISPILDISTPTSLNTTLFVKEIKMSKQGQELLLELIPNNTLIIILYAFVLLMGLRESMAPDPMVGNADMVLATSVLFISFLFANLLLFKRTLIKKIQRK